MTTSSVRAMLLGAAITASVGVGYVIGAQPHMNESIDLLLSARGELQAATPNKGGHRERAMGLIDQAISEVRAGIAGPMADACATSPTPPRMPARAAFTSAPMAAAAATAVKVLSSEFD